MDLSTNGLVLKMNMLLLGWIRADIESGKIFSNLYKRFRELVRS
ncbi:MAG TPA: hypothetical protein V6D11_20445 [Waterburya sp.]